MQLNGRGHISINLGTNDLVVCKKKQLGSSSPFEPQRRQESDISAVSLCEVELVLDKAKKRERQRSEDNVNVVLTCYCSAQQEGYSMMPEWWMMHEFPDSAKKEKKKSFNTCHSEKRGHAI